ALVLADRAEAAGLEHPLILTLAAEASEARGDDEWAASLLQSAVELGPDQAETWRRLATVQGRLGLLEPARAAAERALALAAGGVPYLMVAGAAAFAAGDLEAARAHYQAAAASGGAEAIEKLAAVAVRRGETEEARKLAGRALAISPDRPGAVLTLARADMLEADPVAAEKRLCDLLAHGVSDAVQVAALDLRSEARDAQGKVEIAFADCAARNALIARARPPAPAHEPRLEEARRLAAWFSRADTRSWRHRPGDDEEGARTLRLHAFVVGFPRSGATVLEKALASHPQVVSLAEVDCLGEAGRDCLCGPAQLAALADMDQAQADRRRALYWRRVREKLGDNLDGKTLLDTRPLHTLALPVIAKLFPDAVILFAVRDPRDAALSCFRRRFRQNAAVAEFLTLPDAARYYDAVMDLAKVYRALLSLDVLEVRHEAVVADFDAELRRVLNALGLPWHDAVRAAHLQLAGGLNSTGVGQWRRYARHLEVVRPILDPWVARGGYPWV
ncbi:MAG TPA: sulfotransferase, partial [Caulobacteraceae bacterium]